MTRKGKACEIRTKGKSEDPSEDFRKNKRHSWLAPFTWGRPRGRKTQESKGQGSHSPAHAHSFLSLSPLHVFWISMPSCLKGVFSFIF